MALVHTNFNRIIYLGENGFAIFSTRDGFSAKGVILEEPKTLLNTAIVLAGEWELYRGKKTFSFRQYRVQQESLYFFLTRMVGGIPAKTARLLVEQIGNQLDRLLEDDPKALLKVPGIGPTRLARILAKWQQYATVRQLAERLLPFGLSTPMVLKIAEHFGDRALQIVSTQPYRLMEISGIGFKTADEISLKLGVPEDSPERLRVLWRYLLEEEARRAGHSAVPVLELKAKLAEYPFSEADADMALQEELDAQRLICVKSGDTSYLALPWLYRWERAIWANLASSTPVSPPLVNDLSSWFRCFEANAGIVLGKAQRQAVELANQGYKVMCLAGYAGTGKTTTARAILALYQTRYQRLVGCALSGVAANRLQRKTGCPAYTVHALLGYDGRDLAYHRNNHLPYDVIVLDEASMVDSELFYRLLTALSPKAHLVLIGDPAQLPPVGPGQPFADLIRYRLVPTVVLDTIYRQRDDQVIAMFAAKVRTGQVPKGFEQSSYGDFEFITETIDDYFQKRNTLPESELKRLREDCHRRITQRILSLAEAEALTFRCLLQQKQIIQAIWRFQVLSPMQKGDLGVQALNRSLQSIFNHGDGQSLQTAGCSFRKQDKVIHLNNANLPTLDPDSYLVYQRGSQSVDFKEQRVCNGQIGLVVGLESDSLHVFYPQERYIVFYDRLELSQGMLDLAYCLTVHKTQGSEFEHVVMPMTTSHYAMLSPKLLYTAMTRAKGRLTLVGQPYAFAIGVRKGDSAERTTVIQQLFESSSTLD